MLDEEMASSYLVRLVGGSAGSVGRVEVLGAWKRTDRLLGVTFRDLPCGLLSDRVVEVRQTARVAETDLPLRLRSKTKTGQIRVLLDAQSDSLILTDMMSSDVGCRSPASLSDGVGVAFERWVRTQGL